MLITILIMIRYRRLNVTIFVFSFYNLATLCMMNLIYRANLTDVLIFLSRWFLQIVIIFFILTLNYNFFKIGFGFLLFSSDWKLVWVKSDVIRPSSEAIFFGILINASHINTSTPIYATIYFPNLRISLSSIWKC